MAAMLVPPPPPAAGTADRAWGIALGVGTAAPVDAVRPPLLLGVPLLAVGAAAGIVVGSGKSLLL